jgi:pimeloyl-ACP methyl ester carboxylesterase
MRNGERGKRARQRAFVLRDAAMLRALAHGRYADELREFFGEEDYADLATLARAAPRRAARGARKVLILPGILGSRIGRRRAGSESDDVLWMNPFAIARGRLKQLALPAGRRFAPVGVLMYLLARLKLHLAARGFDAQYFPYDWRQSIDAAGRLLAARIARSPHPVCLVAHSMGGLVGRRAMALLPATKVPRLVMLGTPNFGSIAPVQTLRGSYLTLRKAASLDLQHSADFLTRHVFHGFDALYEMLPRAPAWSGVDLFDRGSWPAKGPSPDPARLARARGIGALLAAPDARMSLIAGIEHETVTGIERANGEFVYETSMAGDGTVPLALAQMPGLDTYFVDAAHNGLVNHPQVIDAVTDLLSAAHTRRLQRQWMPTSTQTARVRESTLRAERVKKIDWRRLDAAERERLMGEFSGRTEPAALATLEVR